MNRQPTNREATHKVAELAVGNGATMPNRAALEHLALRPDLDTGELLLLMRAASLQNNHREAELYASLALAASPAPSNFQLGLLYSARSLARLRLSQPHKACRDWPAFAPSRVGSHTRRHASSKRN